MRPVKMTPAHETGNLAELVCTNSMRSDQLTNAVGLLKEEMRRLDSLVLRAADATKVPAGGALAVDRELFSKYITEELAKFDNLHIHHEEITKIPSEGITIIATGPLTSDDLAKQIKDFSGTDSLTSLMQQLQLLLVIQLIWILFIRVSLRSRRSRIFKLPNE